MPWLVLLSAAVVYLSLGQGALYGDGPGILLELRDGRAFENVVHYLHGPIVLGIWLLTGPLGTTLYQAALSASALGTALGVMFVYLASHRLLGDRRSAAWSAALVATCPGILFYATVVELHGVFFTFFGLVALALANMALRPSIGRAVMLGLSTALASLAHATGHLLPAVVIMLYPVLPCVPRARITPRSWLVVAGVVLLVHVTVAVLTLGSLRLLGWGGASVGFAADHMMQNTRMFWPRLLGIPATFLHEWLLPFLPISLTCLVVMMIADAGARRMLAVLYVLVMLYVLPTAILVEGSEFGAYFLPLAWPAALLTARVFSPRWLALLVFLGLCIGVPRLWARETIDQTRQAAASLTKLQPEQKLFFLPVTREDLELCFVGLPRADFYYLPKLVKYDEKTVRASLPILDGLIGRARADGQIVLLTEAGRESLVSAEAAAISSGPAALAAHFAKSYKTVPVTVPGFRGWKLVPLE